MPRSGVLRQVVGRHATPPPAIRPGTIQTGGRHRAGAYQGKRVKKSYDERVSAFGVDHGGSTKESQ